MKIDFIEVAQLTLCSSLWQDVNSRWPKRRVSKINFYHVMDEARLGCFIEGYRKKARTLTSVLL